MSEYLLFIWTKNFINSKILIFFLYNIFVILYINNLEKIKKYQYSNYGQINNGEISK